MPAMLAAALTMPVSASALRNASRRSLVNFSAFIALFAPRPAPHGRSALQNANIPETKVRRDVARARASRCQIRKISFAPVGTRQAEVSHAPVRPAADFD